MQKMKKMLALLLAMSMLTGMLGTAAFAEEVDAQEEQTVETCTQCGKAAHEGECEPEGNEGDETVVVDNAQEDKEDAETSESESTEDDEPEEEGVALLSEDDVEPLADGIDWTATEITISTLEELKEFAGLVNGGNNFKGKTITLGADIDLGNNEWTPIGSPANSFLGTFDGNGNTVSNLTVNGEGRDYQGFFGYISSPAAVKNLTVKNAQVTGRKCVGALIGDAYTGVVENCHVTGKIEITGNYDVGGLTGYGYAKLTDCSVVGDAGSTVTGVYLGNDLEGDNVGGLMGFFAEGSAAMTNCSAANLTVTGTRKVGGLVGSTYANRSLINCSVKNVTVGTNATEEYAAGGKLTTMGVGGLIGLFNGYSGGKLENCSVENITLTNENDVFAKMGYVSGGGRESAKISAPNMAVTDMTISGENIGSNVTINSPALSGEDAVAQEADGAVAQVDGQYFTSLQEAFAAVNNTSGSDTVTMTIMAGAYSPTANEQLKITRANVVIEGAGKNKTIIDCGTYACSGQGGIILGANNITLKDMTVKNSKDGVDAVKVTCLDAVPAGEPMKLLTGCVLENLKLESSGKGHGLNLHGVDGTTVKGVTAVGTKCGVSMANAKNVTVTGSNLTGTWGAIGMMYKANDKAYANPVDLTLGEGNSYTGAIYGENPAAAAVTLTAPQKANIGGAKVKGTENLETDMPVKIEKEGGVFFYTSLQAALAAANSGDTVKLLADVELTTTLNMPQGMTLTIDGDGHKLTPAESFQADGHSAAIAANTNAPYSQSSSYTLKNLTFEGFTGLVRVVRVNFCDALIENCVFNGNTVTSVVTSAYGKVTVKDSSFTGNTAGYAVIDIGSDVEDTVEHTEPATITGNRFAGNEAGTAVIFVLTPTDIIGNDFTENTVGTAGVFAAANANITGNCFSENIHSGTNPNAGAVLAGPWLARDYTINITGNAFDNALSKDGTQLSAVVVEDWSKTKGTNVSYDLSNNYWGGASPVRGTDYGVGGDADVEAKVTVSSFASSFTKTASGGVTVTTHTEHTFGAWVTDTAAQVGVAGSRHRDCTVCGHRETGTIPMLTPAPVEPTTPPVTTTPDPAPADEEEEDLNENDTPLVVRPFLFEDIKENDWFRADVKTMFDRGLIGGMTETTFAPQAASTRAMVATLLYRMAGEPSVDGLDVTVTDVKDTAWYHDAAVWAYANGIFVGDQNGSFRGNEAITREQLVAVLNRYAAANGVKLIGSADLESFTDADSVSKWALEDMKWAVSAGLIKGRGGKLDAQETANRAELVTLLVRLEALLNSLNDEAAG